MKSHNSKKEEDKNEDRRFLKESRAQKKVVGLGQKNYTKRKQNGEKFIINAQYGKVMASRNKIEVKFLKCDQVQGVEL